MEQVDFTETTQVTIACKFCGSTDVMKWGFKDGIQRYWCKRCDRKFVANNALPRMRYPPEQIASGLSLFYEGLSLSAIQRQLEHDYGVRPSDSTIYEWVTRFTKQAVDGLKHMGKVQTGELWAADETVLSVAGGKTREGVENSIWFWDVIDEQDTKFLLASHMSETRTTQDAVVVFAKAAAIVAKPPRLIVTDKLSAYLDGIERVFGADTKHILSEGMRSATHNNIIERFHGTVKQRTKVMRGLKSRKTARLILDGWLIHYNFFRPHEALKDKTPGEVAQADYPWHSWREVVMHGYIPTEQWVTMRLPT